MSVLKQTRLSVGLSIEKAAKKLNISAGYLSQIENGHRKISKERATEIAELYHVPKEKIFLASRYSIREVNETNQAID